MVTDKPLRPFVIPLNGRWKPGVDPLLQQGPGEEGDFSVLENMRYTENSIQAVMGQTKLNSQPLSNVTIQSGVQLRRDSPQESQIIVQATDANGDNPKLYVNSTPVPSNGEFESAPIYTEDTGAGIMRASSAPTGTLVMCDGKETLVYAGREYSIARYLDQDPAGTYNFDYTEEVTNSLQSEYATIHRAAAAIDSNTMLLLHFDNNVTDSSPTTPHTMTNSGVTFSSGTYRFGVYSAYFNGNAYLSTPDDADFNFSGGTWTVDFWYKWYATVSAPQTVYYQQTDSSNLFQLILQPSANLQYLYPKLSIYSGGSEVLSLTSSIDVRQGGWHHVAFVENGDNYYIFVDGSLAAYTSSTTRPANYTGNVFIGSNGSTNNIWGYLDEYRVSDVARWTSAFSPPSAAYGSDYITTIYIGTRIPASGFKFYVLTPNTTGTLDTPTYWNGTWTAVTGLNDGTASAGKTLAQTGTISFNGTSDAVPKSSDGSYIYWYKFVFRNLDTTTTIYQVTEKTDVQPIRDLWDGVYRNTLAFFKYNGTTYTDYTMNVRGRQYYVSSDSGTYFQASGLSSTTTIVVGFAERAAGVFFDLDSLHVNTTSGCLLSGKYWDGTNWAPLSGLVDGTQAGNSSFGTSGVVTWTSPDPDTEFKKTINNGVPLYYYQFAFSATIASSDVRLIGVFGISAPKTIRGHKWATMWQNRLVLGNEADRAKNTLKISAANTLNVFNGSDSMDISFGDDTEITIGGALFNRFGTSLTDNLIVCKSTETWVVDGTGPSNWTVYRVSSIYGCPAPGTFRICDVGYEIAPGINKHIAIWCTGNAVVLFDQNAVLPIHDDIIDYFQSWRPEYINTAMLQKFYADYDVRNREYHLYVATGNSTTLDTELVFDLKRKRWYKMNRGNKKLSGSFPVTDANGNLYNYGFDHNGYIYLLESGSTFDGDPIAARFVPKDQVFAGLTVRTQIYNLRLFAKSKNVTMNKVSVTHYADTATTASKPEIQPISLYDTGRRIAMGDTYRSITTPPAIVHTLEFAFPTSDETVGFEPIAVAGHFKVVREDMGEGKLSSMTGGGIT